MEFHMTWKEMKWISGVRLEHSLYTGSYDLEDLPCSNLWILGYLERKKKNQYCPSSFVLTLWFYPDDFEAHQQSHNFLTDEVFISHGIKSLM